MDLRSAGARARNFLALMQICQSGVRHYASLLEVRQPRHTESHTRNVHARKGTTANCEVQPVPGTDDIVQIRLEAFPQAVEHTAEVRPPRHEVDEVSPQALGVGNYP